MPAGSLSFASLPPRPSAVGKPDILPQVEHLAKYVSKWADSARHYSVKTPTSTSILSLVSSLESATSQFSSEQLAKDTNGTKQQLSTSGVPLSQVWSNENKSWSLLHDFLPLQSPFADPRNPSVQVSNPDQIEGTRHDGDDLLHRFMNSSHDADVMFTILRWLESNVEQKYKPTAGVLRSQRSMITTCERIKNMKRVTQKGGPLELGHNSEAQARLGVTSHLDPDAQTRQSMKLADADMTEEHRVWKQIYLFLRCGSPLEDIYTFSKERGEIWRYLSLGLGVQDNNSRFQHLELPNSKLRLSIWRDTCLKPDCDPYKAACYAILSGWPDLIGCVEKVSQGWEDLFYAQVNSWLLQELASFATAKQTSRPKPSSKPWVTILADINSREKTSAELRGPIPQLQISIINQTFLSLARDLGLQVGRNWKDKNRNQLSPFIDHAIVPIPSYIAPLAQDSDAVRVVANMLTTYYLSQGDPESLPHEDPAFNVVIEYVTFLLRIGSQDTIPTYLRLLPMKNRMRVFGFILLQLDSEHDKRKLVTGMGNSISGKELVGGQYIHVIQQSDFGAQLFYPHCSFSIIDKSSDEFYPGFTIRNGVANQAVTYWEDQAIRSLQLLLLTPDDWESAFGVLTRALLDFLTLGRIGAARLLLERLPPATVSQTISPHYFATAVDIMKKEPTQLTRSISLYSHSLQSQVTMMKDQASIYYELHQLVELVTSLSEFEVQRTPELARLSKIADSEEEKTGSIGKPLWAVLHNARPFMRGSLSTAATKALTEYYPDLLPKLEAIRSCYLPQAIIASMIVIHTISQIISPTYLTHILLYFHELAQEQNQPLMACFVHSDRLEALRVLVTRSSLTLLKLNELRGQRALGTISQSNTPASRLDTSLLWTVKRTA